VTASASLAKRIVEGVGGGIHAEKRAEGGVRRVAPDSLGRRLREI
jgi:hypothetical protein